MRVRDVATCFAALPPSRVALRRAGKRCATFVFLSAAVACNTFIGPAPIDRNWHVHDGPHVSFYVRPGSFAEQNAGRLSEVAEDQFAATVAALRLTYAGRVRAYAYNSAADADFEFTYSGRGYPETEAFRFVCVAPLGDNLFGLMSHEANHVFIIGSLGRAGTFFITEGLATALLSETFHRAGRHFLFPWTRANRAQLPSLSKLVDDGEWGKVPSQVAYNTSASFLAWLLDTYGPDPLRQIYAASSEEFRDRFAAAYGRSLEALEAEWLRFTETFSG
jgi:hypothetical protein